MKKTGWLDICSTEFTQYRYWKCFYKLSVNTDVLELKQIYKHRKIVIMFVDSFEKHFIWQF